MLNLILGRAGTGKTRCALDICKKLCQKDKQVIFIVPEQGSFTTEKQLLELVGAKGCLNAEVLSFTRLADRIFRKFGGVAGKKITKSGMSAIMTAAVGDVFDRLSVYQNQNRKTEIAQMMLQSVEEFKTRCITPDMLLSVSGGESESVLGKKLRDISLIFSAFEARVAQTGINPYDDITRAVEVLRLNKFFANYTVIIDSFKSFTPDEESMLKYIILQSENVFVTLCTDSVEDPLNGLGLFSPIKETAARLISIAKESGVKIAPIKHLNKVYRFKTGGLRLVEEGLYDSSAEYKGEIGDEIKITSAQGKHFEARECFKEIHRLISEEGYRYRDIALLVRNLDPWKGTLSSAANTFNIPVFLDDRSPADTHPISVFTLTALKIIGGKGASYQSADIFRWLKTGLTDIDEEEIYALENYTLMWGINGRRWLSSFISNPQGYREANKKSTRLLEKLNDIRKRVIEPLAKFEEECKAKKGTKIAEALYNLMLRCNCQNNLLSLAKDTENSGFKQAEDELRMWDALMSLLNEAYDIIGNGFVTVPEFYELFAAMISACDLGNIPMYCDRVIVAAADTVRLSNIKALFVLGVNDGEFPAQCQEGGVFSDIERKRLIELGLPVSKPTESKAIEERLLVYLTLTQPSEKLYLSYSTADGTGAPLNPSEIISNIKRLFTNINISICKKAENYTDVKTEKQAFELLSEGLGQNTPFAQGLLKYFEENPDYTSRLKTIKRANSNAPFKFENSQLSRTLFGENMRISASKVEKFHSCRFLYFCRYGLNLNPRKTVKLDAMEYGNVVHFLFENIFSKYGGKGVNNLSASELKQEIIKLLTEYMDKVMGGTADKTKRFNYLFGRLADSAYSLIKRMGAEFAQSEFDTCAFELKIGKDGEVAPIEFKTSTGMTLSVEGSIDRVDIMKRDGKKYIRVVDYKTGTKEFHLTDILYGLNMQMLIYLISLWQNGTGEFEGITPAGILYMPSKRPAPQNTRESVSGEEVAACMNGLLLDDIKVLQGMEKTLSGVYIPIKLSSKGEIKGTESLIDLEGFGKIARHIEHTLIQMGDELSAGNIPALPTIGTFDICQNCDFRAVCGHEPDDYQRIIEKMNKDDILKEIENELNGGGVNE